MYEGENQITFSEETINKLFSKFMSGLFQSSLTVTSIITDYKSLTVNFTADTKVNDAVKPTKEEESEVA